MTRLAEALIASFEGAKRILGRESLAPHEYLDTVRKIAAFKVMEFDLDAKRDVVLHKDKHIVAFLRDIFVPIPDDKFTRRAYMQMRHYVKMPIRYDAYLGDAYYDYWASVAQVTPPSYIVERATNALIIGDFHLNTIPLDWWGRYAEQISIKWILNEIGDHSQATKTALAKHIVMLAVESKYEVLRELYRAYQYHLRGTGLGCQNAREATRLAAQDVNLPEELALRIMERELKVWCH